MVAAVGPAILDYVTRDLVERNLQLHEGFARDTEFSAKPFQAIAQVGELRQIAADADVGCPNGRCSHKRDIAISSRKISNYSPAVVAVFPFSAPQPGCRALR
jgi:hypothetical protein